MGHGCPLLQGQACAWEKVNSETLATVEDVEGIAIGMSLAAISEQMLVAQPAIKMQDECVWLHISELKNVSRFQPVQCPALDHIPSDQSQQPGMYGPAAQRGLFTSGMLKVLHTSRD